MSSRITLQWVLQPLILMDCIIRSLGGSGEGRTINCNGMARHGVIVIDLTLLCSRKGETFLNPSQQFSHSRLFSHSWLLWLLPDFKTIRILMLPSAQAQPITTFWFGVEKNWSRRRRTYYIALFGMMILCQGICVRWCKNNCLDYRVLNDTAFLH